MLDTGMIFQPGPGFETGMAGEVIRDEVQRALGMSVFQLAQEAAIVV
jgi:hypothetical protein